MLLIMQSKASHIFLYSYKIVYRKFFSTCCLAKSRVIS